MGYQAWLDQQMNAPASSHRALLDQLGGGTAPDPAWRTNTWFLVAVQGNDQLRQRVAFALSQIFVVSELELPDGENARGLATYYDMLASHSFGNYRDLLEDVSLSPMMGIYLSHIRNEKPQPARNVRSDENYARECMQLFSIGLVQLDQDGVARVGTDGVGVPTYDQETIENFAHVFTGWTYAGTSSWRNPSRNVLEPMIAFEEFHDTSPKLLLNGGTLPGGQTARQDLEGALDNIFAHPNVPPFICRQLIQRLVTSNPSRDYIRRVADVFVDNGSGVRGDLRAVVRAILLDDEARNGHVTSPSRFGKLREPLLKQTALWRAFHAIAANSMYVYPAPERDLAQGPLRSPSVFNFFRPDYKQPGEIADNNVNSPEFQILTESAITGTTNRMFLSTFDRYNGRPGLDGDDVIINIDRERSLASDIDALLDHLTTLLLSGNMTADMRREITQVLLLTPNDDGGTNRVLEAIFLIVTSPEFAVQR